MGDARAHAGGTGGLLRGVNRGLVGHGAVIFALGFDVLLFCGLLGRLLFLCFVALSFFLIFYLSILFVFVCFVPFVCFLFLFWNLVFDVFDVFDVFVFVFTFSLQSNFLSFCLLSFCFLL